MKRIKLERSLFNFYKNFSGNFVCYYPFSEASAMNKRSSYGIIIVIAEKLGAQLLGEVIHRSWD